MRLRNLGMLMTPDMSAIEAEWLAYALSVVLGDHHTDTCVRSGGGCLEERWIATAALAWLHRAAVQGWWPAAGWQWRPAASLKLRQA